MQRLSAFSFAVLFGVITSAGTLSAQSATPAAVSGADKPLVYVLPSPPNPDCPVSMHAEQKAGGATVLVTRDGQKHPVPKQIRLTLAGAANGPQIVSASVTVRGSNGQSRMVPTGSLRLSPQPMHLDGSGDSTRTLALTFFKTDEGMVAADMDLTGLAYVITIRLDSITYSDGSTWVAPGVNVCRTAPDPFMLVSSK